MLDDLGLAAAVEHHVTQFSERTGIACSLAMNKEEFDVDGRSATTVFRVVQEALTNVARHAAASKVAVRIEDSAAGMRLSVADDGCGFGEAADKKTFGLLGMQESVEMIGGQLEITSVPGQGTRIEVRIPKHGGAIHG